MVAAGAADRWFTHAFRQKAPEVVEALCHQLTHTDAEGYAACCEALAAADLRGEVGQIPLPTLIIAGESDPVTTVGDAHFLQQQIPASEVVVLAASHLSNIEAPKSFTSALLSFFRGTPWMINSAIRTGWRYGAKYWATPTSTVRCSI